MSRKSELPTPKRLRDARKQGNVCKSQEIASAAGLLFFFGLLAVLADLFWNMCTSMFTAVFEVMNVPYPEALERALDGILPPALSILAVVIAGVAVAGTVAGIAQVGILVTAQPVIPSLNKLNPTQWFKKTFSLRNGMELVKTIVKSLVIGLVAVHTLQKHIPQLLVVPHFGPAAMLPALGALFLDLFLYTAPAFIVLAAADYFVQRRHYIRELMMSKEEVMREYREMEGDPQIKSKRRQLQQEMAMVSTLENVRRASVIVTNPTRVAIALLYDEEQTPLPVVVGKGEGEIARRILEIARQEGIPVMQNVPLARALLRDGVENEYIPADLIRPVAEVLRWAEEFKNG